MPDAYPERSYYGGPNHECPYRGAVFGSKRELKALQIYQREKQCTTFVVGQIRSVLNNIRDLLRP
jgi:hypothetical protein